MLEGYFLDIDDIMLRAYRKTTEGDLSNLRRDPLKGDAEKDRMAWTVLYDTYLAKIGIGEKQEQFMELQLELTELNIEYAETGDRFLLNEINRLTEEMNGILNSTEKGSILDAVAFVMSQKRMVIDEGTISAGAFFRLFELVIKEIKQHNGKESNERGDN